MSKTFRFSIPFILACLLLGMLFYIAGSSSRVTAASSQPTKMSESGEAALIVNTLEDELNNDNDCSLREAIEAANINAPVDDCGTGDVLTDTITFDVVGTITVTSQLSVTAGGSLVIEGGEVITTSGGGTTRVWWVESGSELTLQNLAVVNGVGYDNGAGLFNHAADVTIANCQFSNNRFSNGYGGAIYSQDGMLTILESSFEGNGSDDMDSFGGGIAIEGGGGEVLNSIFQNNESVGHSDPLSGIRPGGGGAWIDGGLVTIQESTFFSNTCPYGGGGIVVIWPSALTVSDSAILSNQAGASGGGIVNGGALTITNSTFSGNSAVDGGGGIDNYGTLTITGSTFSGNTVSGLSAGAGGIVNGGHSTISNSTFSSNSAYYGGGIVNVGPMSIVNSTFSGNVAEGGDTAKGGGMINLGALNIASSTFSGNSATGGGGGITNGLSEYPSLTATMTVTNTIIANSLAGGDCLNEGASTIIDGGHNLDSDGTCGLDPAKGSLPNTDPLLGPLQDNGGPTWTHALLNNSPAIDAGDDATCPPTDQRGAPRPLDGNGDGEAICDIGSFEYEPGHLVVTTLEDELNSDGDCSLREAIEAANTNAPVDDCSLGSTLTDTITFDVAGTITVTSQLSVTAGGPLVIDGGEVITTSGGGTTRVWWVEMGSVLTLQRLAVTDGFVGWNNGAGLYNNAGNLTIIKCKFVRNRFTYNSFGGGIYSLDGTLNILDSLIAENGSLMNVTSGGGIAIDGGVGEIIRTSIQYNESYGACGLEVCVSGGGGLALSSASVVTIYESGILSNTTYVYGGGVYNEGMLTVVNSTLSGNNSGQEGGAISNYGTLTVTNSTLSGNTSSIEYYYLSGGAILNKGTLSITNSTLTGNHAWSGGAIANGGTLTVTNSTLSGNSADEVGGGLFSFGTTLTAINTIAANSLSGGDCSGAIIDGGHNLDSDGSCGLDPAKGSLPNTDPLLGPLQDNGGPTWTHALLEDSPAIDAGDDVQCPPTDQRGVPRPIDGDGDGIAVCDIGSYEIESETVSIETVFISGETTGTIGDFYTFTAHTSPISATLPITFLWQTIGQTPITHTGGLSDTVSYIWDSPGTQAIIVTATNFGGTVTDTHTITITDVPIAGLVATNDSPTLLGTTTTFTATVEAGTNVTYIWDFGDDFTGSGSMVTHTYAAAGVYTATVTAGNSAGSVQASTVVNVAIPKTKVYMPIIIRGTFPGKEWIYWRR